MSRCLPVAVLAACATTPRPADPSQTVKTTEYRLIVPGDQYINIVRISGTTAIVPDLATKNMIGAMQPPRVISSWKLCMDETGAVASVDKLKSSGFMDYDATIRRELHKWQYKPYVVRQGLTGVHGRHLGLLGSDGAGCDEVEREPLI